MKGNKNKKTPHKDSFSRVSTASYKRWLPVALIAVNVFVVFISYSLYMRPHFAIDTYSNIIRPTEEIARAQVRLGRWVSALIDLVMGRFGLHPSLNQQGGFFAFASTLGVCSALLVLRIKAARKEMTTLGLIILNVIVLISFANVFTTEWFHFAEGTVPISVAVASAIAATLILTKTWSVYSIVVSYILVVISCNAYQAFFEMFVIYSLCILLVQSDFRFSKEALCKVVKVLAVGGTAVISSIFLTSLITQLTGVDSNNRIHVSTDPNVILGNIKLILGATHKNLYLFGLQLLPKGSVILYTLIMLAVITGCAIYLVKTKQRAVWDITFIVAIFAGCYVVVFAPHLVSDTFWTPPRTMIPFFSWLSLLGISAFLLSKNIPIRAAVSVICAVFLTANMVSIQQIAADNLITNALDQKYAIEVVNEIEKYEQSTGIEVTRIAHKNDTLPAYVYSGVVKTATFDMNISSRITTWALGGLIFYSTGRLFEQLPMDDEIFASHFEGKNWDSFVPEEQMYFDGDLLYLVVY